VHPAGAPQFTHPRIDDRNPGRATLPCAQIRAAAIPSLVRKARVQRLIGSGWKVEQQVMRKFAPTDLTQEAVRAFGSCSVGRFVIRCMVTERRDDLPRSNFAKM
jgi:hypothetical protein